MEDIRRELAELRAYIIHEAAELGTSIAYENPAPEAHGVALVYTDKWNHARFDTKNLIGDSMRLNWFKNSGEHDWIYYSIKNGTRDVINYVNGDSDSRTFPNGRVFFCINTDIVEMMVRMIRNKFALNWMYNIFEHEFDGEPMGFTVAVHQIWAFAGSLPLADGDHAIGARVFGYLV